MTTAIELTDKGRWALDRIRELIRAGFSVTAAFDLADHEAEALFPREGETSA